ncbi:MAG: hypothetical protein AAGF66_06345 [Cyanobacteria bacterium P01_H01_bin.119]
MFGTFQQSNLRIEVAAASNTIRESLIRPINLRQWLWPQQLSTGLPDQLIENTQFTSRLGIVTVEHQVDQITDNSLRLLLYGGIDGFHEWYWGEGWLQSQLEGVSLLPLNLGQTVTLLNLRRFLAVQSRDSQTA